MENIDPLDRKEVDRHKNDDEDHSQEVQQPIIKREMDSLDDFEHLGHDDSSPLKEQKQQQQQKVEEDLLDLRNTESPAGETLGVINKGDEIVKAATRLTDDDNSPTHFDRSPPATANKMDTNLLQMGDTLDHQKVDKLVDDFTTSGNTEGLLDKEVSDFKVASKNFMDMEREFIQSSVKNSSDFLLDRYSDSESDVEQPKKQLENVEKANEPAKVIETFKDVEDVAAPILDDLPKQTVIPSLQSSTSIPSTKSSENVEDVKKEVEVKKVEPSAPPAQKVVVEKTKKENIIEAEAMFCKMGLGKFSFLNII